VITRFIEDAIAESRRGSPLRASGRSATCARRPRPLVGFSGELAAADAEIKAFLFANMYRHPRSSACARRPIGWCGGCSALFRDPGAMPEEWAAAVMGADEADRARSAADYIAGMTDRFAISEHRRIFDEAPDLR
jgi:dGTPase